MVVVEREWLGRRWGGWLARRGHATELISKLNGLAISGRTANAVLHVEAKQSPLQIRHKYAVIIQGRRGLIKSQFPRNVQSLCHMWRRRQKCSITPGGFDWSYLLPPHLMTAAKGECTGFVGGSIIVCKLLSDNFLFQLWSDMFKFCPVFLFFFSELWWKCLCHNDLSYLCCRQGVTLVPAISFGDDAYPPGNRRAHTPRHSSTLSLLFRYANLLRPSQLTLYHTGMCRINSWHEFLTLCQLHHHFFLCLTICLQQLDSHKLD